VSVFTRLQKEMGTLQTLLLDDAFDFRALFKAILDTHWSIAELALLACMCKLARAWVRYQYAQCTFLQLADLLWNMPNTCTIHGRMVPKKESRVGQLVWTKCLYTGNKKLHIPERFTGICRIDSVPSRGSVGGRWLIRFDTSGLTDKQIDDFKTNFRAGKTGVALFPMFDEQTLLIIRREEPVDNDDREYIKKARFSRVEEV